MQLFVRSLVPALLLGLGLVVHWLPASVSNPNQTSAQTPRSTPPPPARQSADIYETRANHDPEGTGKFYQGREIAYVMGFQGAEWLERPERIDEEQPEQVVATMKLKPTEVVADIGAGTGYFTFRFARAVPQGKVYAVDVQPEMLALLNQRKAAQKATNVVTVQSTAQDAKLPADSLDVAFMADVYHEFEYPYEMMQSIVRALKPGGRLIQLEYRGEDAAVPIKRTHKMTVKQVRKEQEFIGLKFVEVKNFLPQQHFIVFEKPAK